THDGELLRAPPGFAARRDHLRARDPEALEAGDPLAQRRDQRRSQLVPGMLAGDEADAQALHAARCRAHRRAHRARLRVEAARKACAPILVCWCTAVSPPRITQSPISTCPPSAAQLAKTVLSPTTQSCATCEKAMNRLSLPITVTPLSRVVPRLMVQLSRNT